MCKNECDKILFVFFASKISFLFLFKSYIEFFHISFVFSFFGEFENALQLPQQLPVTVTRAPTILEYANFEEQFFVLFWLQFVCLDGGRGVCGWVVKSIHQTNFSFRFYNRFDFSFSILNCLMFNF